MLLTLCERTCTKELWIYDRFRSCKLFSWNLRISCTLVLYCSSEARFGLV